MGERGQQWTLLHAGQVHNINCMINDSKRWAVMHPISKLVLLPWLKRSVNLQKDAMGNIPGLDEDGTIVGVDPNQIDLREGGEHEDFNKLQWFEVDLQAGDCLYLPPGWWHHVSSSVAPNMAVNVWWSAHDNQEQDRSQPLECPLAQQQQQQQQHQFLTLDQCSWKRDHNLRFTECPKGAGTGTYPRAPVPPVSLAATWAGMQQQEVLLVYKELLKARQATAEVEAQTEVKAQAQADANVNSGVWSAVAVSDTDSVELPFGAVVRVGMGGTKPLKKNPKLNGRMGIVLGWSTKKKSYLVHMTGDEESGDSSSTDTFQKKKKKKKKKKKAPRPSKIPIASLEWNGNVVGHYVNLGEDKDTKRDEYESEFPWRDKKPANDHLLYAESFTSGMHTTHRERPDESRDNSNLLACVYLTITLAISSYI
jgi:hypothetical protein